VDAALADGGVLFAVNRLSPLDRARVEPSIRCGAGVSEPVTLRKAVLTILSGSEPVVLRGTSGQCS